MPRLRFSRDGKICMREDDDGTLHAPTQQDMDTLDVGKDLSKTEMAQLEE